MTDEELKDRLTIGDRLAACTQAGDARKADAYAECFTEDGVLQLDQISSSPARSASTTTAITTTATAGSAANG